MQRWHIHGLKESIAAKTNEAITQLERSRGLAIAAALLVIAGSALAWADVLVPSDDSPAGRPALVTADGGKVRARHNNR